HDAQNGCRGSLCKSQAGSQCDQCNNRGACSSKHTQTNTRPSCHDPLLSNAIDLSIRKNMVGRHLSFGSWLFPANMRLCKTRSRREQSQKRNVRFNVDCVQNDSLDRRCPPLRLNGHTLCGATPLRRSSSSTGAGGGGAGAGRATPPKIHTNEHRFLHTAMLLENLIGYPGLFAFLLRGFIKRQRVPVYPPCRGFLAEIRGKNDCLMIGTLRNSTLTRRACLEASPGRACASRRAGLSQGERYQNRSFSANWICREVP